MTVADRRAPTGRQARLPWTTHGARRQSTLSAVMRDCWDGHDLFVITKGKELRATGAHVAGIGHITADELRRELTDTEAANGSVNRWLVLAARRSKVLADPPPFEGLYVQQLAKELREAIIWARDQDRMVRSPAATELWDEMYVTLSRAQPGLVGAMLARAEAHVLRLSLIYALLDCSAVVLPQHLEAAREVWLYVERSVRMLFGPATGNAMTDRILHALAQHGELTRTQLRDLFGRHASEGHINAALAVLRAGGWALEEQHPTDGRAAEVWRRA